MGTWSHESFGCDEACDWAARLIGATDLAPVEAGLDAVLAAGDDTDLDAIAAVGAIVSAEVVARLQGRWGLRDAHSADADRYVERLGLKPSRALVDKAWVALDRVLARRSELAGLWEDTTPALEAAWRAGVEELKARLAA